MNPPRSPRTSPLARCGLAAGLCLPLALAAGCKKNEDEGGDSSYTPPPELASWSPSAAEVAKPAAGPVYFAVKDQGIAIIDGNGSRLAVRLENDAQAMTVTKSGELLFTTFQGLYALRNGEAVEIADDEETLGLTTLETGEDVREDPKGRIWVIGSKGTIAVSDPGSTDKWTTITEDKTGMDLQFRFKEMLFDKDGRSWLAADDNLYRQTGDELKWEAFDVSGVAPEDYMRNFNQIAMVADGTIVTGLSQGVVVYADGGWKKAAVENNMSSVDHLAAHGSTIAVMVGSDLHVVGPDGTKVIKAGDGTWKASRIFDLDIDGSGRIWIATDNGPVVVEGEKATQWTPGTLPGVLGRVESIVIAGAGPATLPGVGEVIKGAVEVGFTKQGQPLAGIEIEMCEDPKQVFSKSPCEDAVWKWGVDTGANGRVRFTDVPVGTYGLVWKIGADWHEYFNPMHPFECCTQIQAGQTLDVGVFEVGE